VRELPTTRGCNPESATRVTSGARARVLFGGK
jgi:hypothetical protein